MNSYGGGIIYFHTQSHSVHLAGEWPLDSFKAIVGKGSVAYTMLYKFTKESSFIQKVWMLTEV